MREVWHYQMPVKSNFKLTNILKSSNKSVKTVEKRSFLNNIGLFLSAREKILNNFRIKIFSTKNTIPAPKQAPEPTPETVPAPKPAPEPTKHKTPKFKLHKKLRMELTAD